MSQPTQTPELDVVTGSFSYTGSYITQRLLAMGKRVKSLTSHPDRPNPFGGQVSTAPYAFDNPSSLTRSLEGATTLYNTYWIRFPYKSMTFAQAVQNSLTLIQAARDAGVRRLVHLSITNASEDSPLPYFRGKGQVETAILRSGLSYAILRPTVVFGSEDILISNIAWFLRRLPVFPVFGRGDYQIQPVYVEDVASLAVQAGQQEQSLAMDAVGPETYTFEGMVRLIAQKLRRRTGVIHLPPRAALLAVKLSGYLVRDVVLTWEEVQGLMAGLLVSQGPSTGQTRLSQWLEQHADTVGARYASELGRHYR